MNIKHCSSGRVSTGEAAKTEDQAGTKTRKKARVMALPHEILFWENGDMDPPKGRTLVSEPAQSPDSSS